MQEARLKATGEYPTSYGKLAPLIIAYAQDAEQIKALVTDPRFTAELLHPDSDEQKVAGFVIDWYQKYGTPVPRSVLLEEFEQYVRTHSEAGDDLSEPTDISVGYAVEKLQEWNAHTKVREAVSSYATGGDRTTDTIRRLVQELNAIPLARMEEEVRTPEFPLEAFSPNVATVIDKLASAQDVSLDYVGMKAIGVGSGVVGNTANIRVASAWRPQPANIFGVVVGPPGSAKTEAGWQMTEPVHRRQRELDEQYANDLDAYLASKGKGKQRFADQKKRHDAAVKQAIKDGTDLPDPPEESSGGSAPVREFAWTESSTVEGLADALATSPRGLLVMPDELSKLWLSLNKYSGGDNGDKQHYLEAWNCGTWNIKRADRSKDKQIDKVFLTVFGGIQPDLLPLIKGDYNDGTLERWLYCWPEVTWLADAEDGVDMSFLGMWDDIVARLYDLTTGPGGEPTTVKLDDEARTEWRRFYQTPKDQYDEGVYQGFAGKAGQYWSRLALILHLLRWAEGKVGADYDQVGVESARGASLLMDYFFGMAVKVHAILGSHPGDRHVTSRDVTGSPRDCWCIGAHTDACRQRRRRRKARGL